MILVVTSAIAANARCRRFPFGGKQRKEAIGGKRRRGGYVQVFPSIHDYTSSSSIIDSTGKDSSGLSLMNNSQSCSKAKRTVKVS